MSLLRELLLYVGHDFTDPVNNYLESSRIAQTNLWLTIMTQVFEIMEFVGVITSDSVDLIDIGIAARPIGGGWALCGW